VAGCLAEAREHLVQAGADLVLCDAIMPGVDGFELCRAIKAHPEWRYTPFILITALDGQSDLLRGLDAGADEFLTKPVDKVVLRARVRVMLRIRAQYREARRAPRDLDSMLRERREQLVAEAALSAREREVLDLLLLGRSHEEIGAALGIAIRTSKFHQGNILKKLGADSRVDLPRLFL
jgi:DNA-binding NarL/FixJ family response regulator